MQRERLTGVRGHSFKIVARITINNEEKNLLSQYRLQNTILTEGDPLGDLKTAAWYT